MSSSNNWQQKERSNGFMLWLIIQLTRHVGPWLGGLLLWPITTWYWLFAPQARHASQAFLQRVNVADQGNSWWHIYSFSRTLLDRVLMVAGESKRFSVSMEGEENIRDHLGNGQGAILLLSHLGSFEMARLKGASLSRPLKVLMNRAQGEKMMAALEAINPGIADSIIDTGVSDTDRVLRVKAALDNGDIVCMMADRSYDGAAMVPVDFLGDTAELPLSPYLLAGVLKVPVVLGFGFYQQRGQYRIVFEPLLDGASMPRKQRRELAAEYAQRYADRLAFWAKQYPYNWFNFFDYWANTRQSKSLTQTTAKEVK